MEKKEMIYLFAYLVAEKRKIYIKQKKKKEKKCEKKFQKFLKIRWKGSIA